MIDYQRIKDSFNTESVVDRLSLSFYPVISKSKILMLMAQEYPRLLVFQVLCVFVYGILNVREPTILRLDSFFH